MSDKLPRQIPALLFCALLAVVSTAALAQSDAERDTSTRFNASARSLIHRVGEGPQDVFVVVEKVVPLQDEQEKSVGALRKDLERAADRGKSDPDNLERAYAGKLRRILDDRQRGFFDEAVKVLAELEEAKRRSVEEFMATVDPVARKLLGDGAARVDTSDLTVYVDLPEPVRKELERLQREMYRSIERTMKELQPPEDLTEGRLRRWKARAFHEAQDKARSSYEEQRDVLLSPAQRERLKELEAAARVHRESLRAAYSEATRRLEVIMANAADRQDDTSQTPQTDTTSSSPRKDATR